MASYLTAAAIERRLMSSFAQLYALPADQTVLEEDMAAVEAVVESYVGRRYAVPVTAPKALALDLAEESAWQRGQSDEIPTKVKESADTARKQLAEIAAGRIALVDAAESNAAGAGAMLVSANDPQFTRDQLGGY